VIAVSARSGEGIAEWVNWMERLRAAAAANERSRDDDLKSRPTTEVSMVSMTRIPVETDSIGQRLLRSE